MRVDLVGHSITVGRARRPVHDARLSAPSVRGVSIVAAGRGLHLHALKLGAAAIVVVALIGVAIWLLVVAIRHRRRTH